MTSQEVLSRDKMTSNYCRIQLLLKLLQILFICLGMKIVKRWEKAETTEHTVCWLNKKISKQANKQANKQTNKQTNKNRNIVAYPESKHLVAQSEINQRGCLKAFSLTLKWPRGVHRDPQQYSTNENPSLSRSNFLANLMHGHSDSSWSGSSLPEITEQRIFHVLFYYEQIRLTCIINCIYPSWLNF